ncbi:MAG: putative 2-dehydropantoate 2-reductase [Myxococcales bacterium]|nr:putative 2-dehydropantoate 2-reductase [Myxococcales bacterium]
MPRIAVFGAGAIGCWVGGRLAAGGADVTLIGRARVIDELRGGLRVSEMDGGGFTVTPQLATEAAAATGADLVIVTVKSAATAEAARALAGATGVIVSMQNGVRNADTLRAALPDRRVIAGMVPFNVVRPEPGRYHRASAGVLMFESGVQLLTDACRAAALPFEERDDMPAVQWAKLLMNLNNAINALSGVPLAQELADRDFRRCLAAAQREALDVLAAAKLPIAKLTILPAGWIARLLPAPDGVFRRLARRIIAIDPQARSSMWDDLEAKRTTEIDYIQGEVVALADKLGLTAPVNAKLIGLIREAETGGRRDFTGSELLRELR